MAWEIYPQGLTEALVRLHREYAPRSILVTESGAAFADQWQPGEEVVNDPDRVAYLRNHIQAVAEARALGAPVHGYCAWSLLDNFEWAERYSKRFGMVYVLYPTQQRIVKTSGRWYAKFPAEPKRGAGK